MAKTEVILTGNIVGLGAESDQVKVASGYARNYLFPQRLAIPVTQANKRRIESLKQRRAEREAHEFNTMSELAKGVAKLVCVVQVKTGEDGKMFGSVTGGTIADQLKHQFDVSLDKRKVHLEHPIRTLGEHDVILRLHAEVTATLKVRVESLTPPPAPNEAPAAEEKREGRFERRGRRSDTRATPTEQTGAEKTEGTERKPRALKTERVPRADRPIRPERTPKLEKAVKPAKTEKAEKAEKTEKAEKSDKPEKPE
jgi:large subunit ribosomal protein L9